MQQVQLPVAAGQGQGLPQRGAGQGGFLHLHQAAALLQALAHPVAHGVQFLVDVLARGGQVRLVGGAQG